MIGTLTLLNGLIFIIFFAQSLPMLLVGEILMGIPWGAFQTLTTTYAAEVYPVSLRVLILASTPMKHMMIFTNELGKASTEGTSYWDCFKGTDLRRTEIVCVVWGIQTMYGASSFTGYSTYFFEQAGLDVSSAFSMSLGQYGLGAVGTLLSWVLMMKFGRRALYLRGQIAMASILLIVGFLGIAPRSMEGAQWGIGAMILSYTFVYDMTVGPVCYSLVAKFSSTRLRNKTVVNWGAKAGFFWAGTGACVQKFSDTGVESFDDIVVYEKSSVEYVHRIVG
ncbi:sugar porter family MFS transporter [Aureobasidium sp. EXF-12298]|nr:sugar porter family MFS transporter [Aureobasidium sp. EXF-12298]